MNIWQTALLIGATVVALFTWQVERAWLWILAGAASFILSAWWEANGLPLHPAVTALCDTAVCVLIFFMARHWWELGLYRLFQCSVLISITYLGLTMWTGNTNFHYAYIVALEAINWLALMLILGVGFMQGVVDSGVLRDTGSSGAIHRTGKALFAPRSPRE